MAAPPMIQGAVQERAIRVGPSALAVSLVGAAGTVGAVVVVAPATLETGPRPTEFQAERR